MLKSEKKNVFKSLQNAVFGMGVLTQYLPVSASAQESYRRRSSPGHWGGGGVPCRLGEDSCEIPLRDRGYFGRIIVCRRCHPTCPWDDTCRGTRYGTVCCGRRGFPFWRSMYCIVFKGLEKPRAFSQHVVGKRLKFNEKRGASCRYAMIFFEVLPFTAL